MTSNSIKFNYFTFFLLYLSIMLFLNFTEFGNFAFFIEAKHLYSATTLGKATLYLFAYLLVILSYVVILLNQSKLARWCFISLSIITLSLHFIFLEVNGYGLKYFEMRLLIHEAKYFNDAFKTFGNQVFFGVSKAVMLSFVLFLPLRVRFRFRPLWLIIAPISFGLAYTILYKTSATRDIFPSTYRAPILAGLTFFGSGDQMYYGPKNTVKIKPKVEGDRKIVYIIDEAVRADFLTINNTKIQTTPFLYSIKNEIKNLGIATSGANCSVDSNTILRTGIHFKQLPDRESLALKMPSHFQYAKAAGYRTYYLDGQAMKGELQNHMSEYDLNSIDEFDYMSEAPKSSIDMNIAKKIITILNKNEKSFIVVNKTGSHFVYNDRYPTNEAIFKPITVVNQFANAPIPEMINGYANVVRWNTDIFFKEIYPTIHKLDHSSLIYTSDHGVSFGGMGDHCTLVNVPHEQAIVPLFIMGKDAIGRFKNNNSLLNKSSHYFIFPSLLVLMGYDQGITTSIYGPPLWEGIIEKKLFMSGDMFARGNQFFLNKADFDPANLPYDFGQVSKMSLYNRSLLFK